MIVVGEDGVVWGYRGSFATPNQTRFVPFDGPARDLEFPYESSQPEILAQDHGVLLYVANDERSSIQEVDLDTGMVSQLGSFGGLDSWCPIVTDAIYCVFRSGGNLFVGSVDRAMPDHVESLADVIAPSALTASDDHLLWIDNDTLDAPTVVYRSSFDTGQIERFAELGDVTAVHGLWNDALWVTVTTESQWFLSRIDQSGDVARFSLDYEPATVAAAGSDGFFVITRPRLDSGEPTRLVVQPLP